MNDSVKPVISVPGHVLWELFVMADELANNPDVAYNENIQYEAIDLVIGLSDLVKEFELMTKETGGQLPYNDSIFTNPRYEWYVDDRDDLA